MYRSGGTPNEPQPQVACELQGRRIEALDLLALVLPVNARRWVLADNTRSAGEEGQGGQWVLPPSARTVVLNAGRHGGRVHGRAGGAGVRHRVGRRAVGDELMRGGRRDVRVEGV
jgi:hypothetical protein